MRTLRLLTTLILASQIIACVGEKTESTVDATQDSSVSADAPSPDATSVPDATTSPDATTAPDVPWVPDATSVPDVTTPQDTVVHVDSVTPDDTTSPDTTQAGCATDDDCSDNLFCNGIERCDPVLKTCLDGAPITCAEDNLDCTVAYCDEESQSCSYMAAQGWCWVDGICVADGEKHPNDACRACKAATNTLEITVGDVCGTCTLCNANGACGAPDPNCCSTGSAPNNQSNCGTGIDVMLPQGCQYTYTHTVTTTGSISDDWDIYACGTAGWSRVESNGDGGSCMPACTPSVVDSWSDSCGGSSRTTITCP